MNSLAARRSTLALLLLLTGLITTFGTNAQSVDQVLLKGPVESVNSQQYTITILGQTLKVSRAVLIATAPGQVLGLIKPAGTAAPFFAKSSLQYVPGGTQVLLSGTIAEVNRALARFRVGLQWVDYTRVLSTTNFAPTVGATVVVLGTQPVIKGTLLATSAVICDPSAVPTITTTITLIVTDYTQTRVKIVGLESFATYDQTTYSLENTGTGGIVGGGIIGPPGGNRRPTDPPPPTGF